MLRRICGASTFTPLSSRTPLTSLASFSPPTSLNGKRRISSKPTGPQGLVAFIGLGNMGLPMAHNLIKNGREVVVYDVSESQVKEAVRSGAIAAKSTTDIGDKEPAVVITMLPRSEHVKEVWTEKDRGLIASLRKPTYLVDASSIDPAVSEEVAHLASLNGHHAVDAPVSGGVPGASGGTLTFMVGGEEEDFKMLEPLLMLMGKRAFYCGGHGKGQAVKVCNNLMMAISMAGACEGYRLGEALGVDLKTLTDVVNTSSGRSWSTDSYNPVPGVLKNTPASRNYTHGFTVDLLCKDLGLASHAADLNKIDLPSLIHVAERYGNLKKNGFGQSDFSCIFKHHECK